MFFRILTALIILSGLLFRPQVSLGVHYNLTGQWNWTDFYQNQSFFGTATINHNGSTLEFTWQWQDQKSANWSGNGVTSGESLSLDGSYNNGLLTAHWAGTILENGNKLQGTWLQSNGQSGTFVATRIGDAPSPFPDPSPSPTPTPSPSPGPQPFLDLPWDYEGKGLTFSEAALAINSFFDHEYPFLSVNITEPIDLINFRGPPSKKIPYSSHDGYDWGKGAKALINEAVLAAGDGCASYERYSDGNNVIKINHGNGYQTRYLHLQDDQYLITKSQDCVNVTKGQRIDSIGYSGGVRPPRPSWFPYTFYGHPRQKQ